MIVIFGIPRTLAVFGYVNQDPRTKRGTCSDVSMVDRHTQQQFFFNTETMPADVEQAW